MRRRKTANQKAQEERWVFSFNLKDESDEAYLTQKGREFRITGPMCWKDLSLRVLQPILGTQKIQVF